MVWWDAFNVDRDTQWALPTVWESTWSLIRRQLISQFWSLDKVANPSLCDGTPREEDYVKLVVRIQSVTLVIIIILLINFVLQFTFNLFLYCLENTEISFLVWSRRKFSLFSKFLLPYQKFEQDVLFSESVSTDFYWGDCRKKFFRESEYG